MAFAPWKPDLYQVQAKSRFYGSWSHGSWSRGRRRQPACTRRMAQWLSDLPSPPRRRPRSLSDSMSFMAEQENKAPSNLDTQTVFDEMHTIVPHFEHENPLRQHPVRHLNLPIRVSVPQRRSSLNFGQRGSHHSLENVCLPDAQATSSPQQTNTAYLNLDLPGHTTTTGLHLNYGQPRASRHRCGLPHHTTTTGFHLNYSQHVATQPQHAVVAPRQATALQSFDSPPYTTSLHTALNMSGQQNQGNNVAQDPIVIDFGARAASSHPPKPTAKMHRQMSQMSQVRQLFGGTESNKDAASRKRTRSEVSKAIRSRDRQTKILWGLFYPSFSCFPV